MFSILDSGYSMLDTRCLLLVVSCWLFVKIRSIAFSVKHTACSVQGLIFSGPAGPMWLAAAAADVGHLTD